MSLPVDLQAGENVLLRVRRHWIFIYPKLALILGVTLFLDLLFLILLFPVGAVIALVISIIGFGYAYLEYYQHKYDEWIVTNQRIVDSVKKNWFHHQMSSADLVNVQDMSVEKSGVFPTMFNYGSLRCQTAGSQAHFILTQIPDPNKILDVIDEARDKARKQPTS